MHKSTIRLGVGPTLVLVALTVGGTPIRAAGLQDQGDNEDSRESISVHKAFHIAGVPGIKRNGRVDIVFSTRTIRIVQGDRESLIVPFKRIVGLRMVAAERDYAKATYAAVLAVGAPGALLLTKKRKVDSLAVEFENEHGGTMSVVVQVPKEDGPRCKEWLRRFGVRVDEGPRSAWLGNDK